MVRQVLIVGSGITGICLARELSSHDDVAVTVLERDQTQPRGSTTFAPGFVGLYNDAAVLMTLAQASADVYDGAGAGFERRGGIELATSDAGAVEVERRVAGAGRAGLPAHLLDPAQLPTTVASFVDTSQVVAAGSFPADGVAEPTVLAHALRVEAEARGARFLRGHAVNAVESAVGQLVVTTEHGARLAADDVVLAGGVWGAGLAALTGVDLPLFPVAHPYVYSQSVPGLRAGSFVRWPEHHVYARVHADRLGIGSYDHAPVLVDPPALSRGAGLDWDEQLTDVVTTAQQLLRPGFQTKPRQRVNGVFAMTPDNLPFLGPHPDLPGVWIAQALWITHAAGAARSLAATMTEDAPLPADLAVDRFGQIDHGTRDKLQDAALRLYRDIYANDAQPD